VGHHPAGVSPFGVFNMADEVGEWVADWYGPYGAKALTNPRGPKRGAKRVVRGGSFTMKWADLLTTTLREAYDERVTLPEVGFRCASSEPARGAREGETRPRA
jgi:formylglycine-generating enzyme